MAVPRHAAAQEPATNMAGLLRSPRQALAPEQVLAMAPGAPFLLKHHWSSWEVASEGLDEACWLPKLKKHVIRPGINQVHTLRVGQADHEAYQDGVQADGRNGWTFIEQAPLDDDHRPAGVPEGGYVREAPARDPRNGSSGPVYLEAWQVPLPGRPGDERGQRFKFDRAAYNRWRLWLVESGQIKPPADDIVADISGRYAARVPTTRTKQWPTTDMATAMTEKAEKVAKLHEEAAVPEAPEAPTPPAPKPRKKKADAKPEAAS